MRALLQRVRSASVMIDNEPGPMIQTGLVIFLGVTHDSRAEEARWLAEKILKLKVFDPTSSEQAGPQSVVDINGDLLVVSQFTLHASTKKGTKPSYHRAASPDVAQPLYNYFVENLTASHPIGFRS